MSVDPERALLSPHIYDRDSKGVRQCDTGHNRGATTRVKTICGRTEYFEVKVTLHYGSALSPL